MNARIGTCAWPGPAAWAILCAVGTLILAGAIQAGEPNLRPPAAFDHITEQHERSRALFAEAGKVLGHPRCMNCHSNGLEPLQGENGRTHRPIARAGPARRGVPALPCRSCHGRANYDVAGVPGHPEWRLPPATMAWKNRTLAEICVQLKDPSRNGGKTLAEIEKHMAADSLAGWAWSPGKGRMPAPGSQWAFGNLIEGWIRYGAHCPIE